MNGSIGLQFALVISLLFLLYALPEGKTDRDRAGLVGPVWTVRTIPDARRGEWMVSTYTPQGNEVETVYHDRHGSYAREIPAYDAQGRKTETVEYSAGGLLTLKTVYTYNAWGDLAAEAHYDRLGDLIDRAVYTYDARGKLKDKTTQEEDGSIKSRSRYTYDARGRTMEVAHEDAHDPGLGIAKTVDLYDAKGNLRENATYYTSGSPPGKIAFTYEFDALGNWIRQAQWLCRSTKSGKLARDTHPPIVATRVITYYEPIVLFGPKAGGFPGPVALR